MSVGQVISLPSKYACYLPHQTWPGCKTSACFDKTMSPLRCKRLSSTHPKVLPHLLLSMVVISSTEHFQSYFVQCQHMEI